MSDNAPTTPEPNTPEDDQEQPERDRKPRKDKDDADRDRQPGVPPASNDDLEGYDRDVADSFPASDPPGHY